MLLNIYLDLVEYFPNLLNGFLGCERILWHPQELATLKVYGSESNVNAPSVRPEALQAGQASSRLSHFPQVLSAARRLWS